MKALILSVLITVVVLWSCKPDNRIILEYPDAGMKEIYTIDKDSLIHGEKLVYLDNGKNLYSKSYYDKGQLNGERYIYYPDGQIEVYEQYIDDVLHDTLKTYYPSGALKLVMIYDYGVLNGVVTKYKETGELVERVTFADNEENGPFEEYHENGQIRWKGKYLNGENEHGLLEEFDDTGEPIRRMMCSDLSICRTTWTKENGDITE